VREELGHCRLAAASAATAAAAAELTHLPRAVLYKRSQESHRSTVCFACCCMVGLAATEDKKQLLTADSSSFTEAAVW